MGNFVLHTARGWHVDVLEKIRAGLLGDLSVGYEVMNGERSGVIGPFLVRSADLLEVSLVREGANPLARVKEVNYHALTAREILGIGA